MVKAYRYDVAFLVLLALALAVLSELDKLDLLFRMPYVTLMVVYFMGRYISVVASRTERDPRSGSS
jgi:hypothetical protein